jgi:hypothetical protein
VVAGGGDHQRCLREVVHAVDPSLVLKFFLDFFNKVMFIQGALTEWEGSVRLTSSFR